MSSTLDLIDLIVDILNVPAVNVTIYKIAHPVGTEGVERITVNTIVVGQVRAGTMKQNNDVVMVNFFTPKLNGLPNTLMINTIDKAIQLAIESFNTSTTRVKYYYLDPQPSTTYNESDRETMTNIRIKATYT